MRRFIDISPTVSSKLAVFPGDQPYSRRISLDMKRGDHLSLSAISATVHLGAHTDAPNHYAKTGEGIDTRDLALYYGPCQVFEVSVPRGRRIRVRDLRGAVHAPRVLFKTGSFPDPNHWNADFNSLSAELIDHLVTQGVCLVGIDTPSVDPADDKELESHQAIARHDMAILEGIVLEHVPPATYTLIALPLKLENADASPVRAVLLSEEP
ncbi:MAG: cyclase family protein [Myxococcota bacterium]